MLKCFGNAEIRTGDSWVNRNVLPLCQVAHFFVVVPKTFQAGLHSTSTALPYANYKTEVLDYLLSIPTHTQKAVANKDKLDIFVPLSARGANRVTYESLLLYYYGSAHGIGKGRPIDPLQWQYL